MKLKRVFICLLSFLMTCMTIPMMALSVSAEETETLLWPVPGHTELIQGYHDAKAIDIGDDTVDGADVVAACSGTVLSLLKCTEQHYGETGDCYGLGTAVFIKGDDDRFYQYAHLQAGSIPSDVKVNAEISQGQLLGKVGQTGDAEKPHLHFGITVGTAYAWSKINPLNETYIYELPSDDSTKVPENPEIEADRYEYNVNETITIKAGADYASYYYGMILKDGKSVWSGEMTNGTLTYNASEYGSGSYKAYAICINENGMTGTDIISYTVTDEYVFPFYDVDPDDWSYSWIKQAHQKGLISGMTTSTFEPDGTLTYAQAITLAARLNQNYTEGQCTLESGTVNWYDTYVEYCYDKGIIDSKIKNYGPAMMNSKIDRATYVGIFANALPASEFAEKNTIEYGSIPDVSQATVNWQSIYLFYRAGILNGSDEEGNFKPYTNIKRSEVAAILIRMVDPDCRVGLPEAF